MLRKFLFLAVALCSISLGYAQEIFSKGTTAINAGIGIGSSVSNVSFPPLSVSMDYSLVDNLIDDANGAISIGGLVGYVGSKQNFYGSTYSASHAILGVRGAFHYQFIPKLDTYAGLMLSYNLVSGSWSGPEVIDSSVAGSKVDLGAYLGARYFFTEQIGAFAELGYTIAFLNLGVTFTL